MLDRGHRLTRADSFATAIRSGRRAGTPLVVLHLAYGDSQRPAQVGLVVGRTVGKAVTRNQVKRRLRHIVRERLSSLPDGAMLVIRALPPASGRTSTALGRDVDVALARLLKADSKS
jgi:ribonuclease P protein component